MNLPARAALLVALLGGALAVSTPALPITTVLSAQPGLSPREVVINVKITNTGSRPLDLLWSRNPRQSCVASLWVRVLKAGSRAVVYPTSPSQSVFCPQDVGVQTLQPGQTAHHGRHLVLPTGRYAVEVTLPGNSAAPDPLPVGYVMVDVR